MAHLQVKNVPCDLHQKLRDIAAREGTSIRVVVLEAIRRRVEREEFRTHLRSRAPVQLDRPAARLLEETRASRDRDLPG